MLMVVFYFTTEYAEFNAELHRGYICGFLLLKPYWTVGETYFRIGMIFYFKTRKLNIPILSNPVNRCKILLKS